MLMKPNVKWTFNVSFNNKSLIDKLSIANLVGKVMD